MGKMSAVILLYGFEDREKLKRIQAAALSQKLRVRTAEEDEYELPVGFLAFSSREDARAQIALLHLAAESAQPDDAGNAGSEERSGGGESGRGRISELMVMAGLDNSQFGGFLAALRKFGAGPIPYKAVLTETNQHWNGYELYREICKEHERMKQLNHPEGR